MRIFFQEMMFHHPGVVVAEPVGGLELRQRILIELELVAFLPWARQLQLVKDAEFHDASPWTACCFGPVYSRRSPSPVRSNSAARKAGLRWAHEWLVLRAMSRSFARDPPRRDPMTAFTPHQDSALKAVADWLKAKPGSGGTPPIFRLFGYAGTGKTTLARHIAEGVDGEVKFAAFTGKAALVMRNKGCDNASTIHSLIYRARDRKSVV